MNLNAENRTDRVRVSKHPRRDVVPHNCHDSLVWKPRNPAIHPGTVVARMCGLCDSNHSNCGPRYCRRRAFSNSPNVGEVCRRSRGEPRTGPETATGQAGVSV